MKRGSARLLICLVVLLLNCLIVPRGRTGNQPSSWPTFRGTPARTGWQPDELQLIPPLSLRWSALRGNPSLADSNIAIEASPVIADGKVYIATLRFGRKFQSDAAYESAVVCLDLQTGQELWKRQLGDGASEGIWSTPAVAGGRVFAATFDGKVYALDATTGALLWAQQVAPPPPQAYRSMRASPIVVGTRLYIAPYIYRGTTRLYALDTQTGTIVTSVPLPGSLYASPAVGQNRLFVLIQKSDAASSRLEAYDISSASVLANVAMQCFIHTRGKRPIFCW